MYVYIVKKVGEQDVAFSASAMAIKYAEVYGGSIHKIEVWKRF